MSVAQRFCALESRAIDDPLAGSGAHAERNLLISWPRPKWQRGMRRASDMSERVSELIETLAAGGRRVNLIHRRDQPSHRHRLFLMPENRGYEVERDGLEAFLTALHHGLPLARWERQPPPSGGLLLCCTHGKKDKCCAKFGYAAYKALSAAAASRRLPLEVWESTHLGGCRLAASAVVFPALRKYGRIAEEHVVPLLESEARDLPYLPCYRGDSRLAPIQQCAQVAALRWLEARGIRADNLEVDEAPDEAPRCRVDVRWRAGGRHGRLSVSCESRTLLRHDTCADLAEGDPTPSRVWVATGTVDQETILV